MALAASWTVAPRHGRCSAQTQSHANDDEQQDLTQHLALQPPVLRTERHTHPHFASALRQDLADLRMKRYQRYRSGLSALGCGLVVLAGISGSARQVTRAVAQEQLAAPTQVSVPTGDNGLIYADLYGSGPRGIVLAHGGRFNKGSWEKQARALAAAGFRVLAFDFRGYGESRGPGQEDIYTAPIHFDVLAAAHYLRGQGATTVAVIGASLGGGAAAQAVVVEPRVIDRLILLGATPGEPAEKLTVRKLYITTRDDTSGTGPRLPGLQAHFTRALEPKELIVLEGSAHAQFMFHTEHADRIMREMLRFLSAP